MAKAFAINTVTICTKPGERGPDGKTVTPAVLEDKLPGTIFDCSDEDFEIFEAAGAVRKPTRAEMAEFKAAESAKPARTVDTKGSSQPSTGGPNLLGDASQPAPAGTV